MARSSIIIALSPSSLRVAVRTSRDAFKVDHTWLNPAEFERAWAEGLESLDEPLAAAIRRLNAKGAQADLLYHGPHTLADVVEVDVTQAGASQAAELSFRENLTDASTNWRVSSLPFDFTVQSKEKSRSLVLVAADRNESLETLAGWLIRAGCGVGRMAPARAVLLRSAARMAKEQKGGDTSAVLILSDWLSAIGISHTGNVKSVRSTDFGFGLLAQAITRAARPPTPAQGTAPPTGDSAQDRALGTVNTGVSYRLLFDIGIPRRGQPIASDFNLQADNILPLMQPVVQRYVIETRQTLRFTFDEATISRTVVRIAGAGTRIPGIAKALENQLEIAIEQSDATAPDSETELLGEFTDAIDRGFALLPRSEVARRMHSRLTKATWRGAAAAGVTLTCLGAILIADRTSVERRFGDLQSRLDSKERHDALKQQAADLSTTIASAQGVLNLAFGERVGWKAMLADLSQLAGEDVRLTEVAGKTSTPDRPGCSLTLRGMTTSTHTAQSSPAPADTKDPLARLIQRLSASPLVADVQVLSSRSGNGEDLTQQVFELLVQLRSLPPLNPADRVAAANEASTPGRGTP